MVDAAYNKFRGKSGHGTLVGNWQEERDLRDFTGEGRYVITSLFVDDLGHFCMLTLIVGYLF